MYNFQYTSQLIRCLRYKLQPQLNVLVQASLTNLCLVSIDISFVLQLDRTNIDWLFMTRMCMFILSVTYTVWSRKTYWFLPQRKPCRSLHCTHWWTFLCKVKHKQELIVRIPWIYCIVPFNFRSTMRRKFRAAVTIHIYVISRNTARHLYRFR